MRSNVRPEVIIDSAVGRKMEFEVMGGAHRLGLLESGLNRVEGSRAPSSGNRVIPKTF